MTTLSGQHAFITGGGSGIGLACARALLNDGAMVTLVGRTEARLQQAVTQLTKAGLEAAGYVVADIAGRYRRNNVSAFHRWLAGHSSSANSRKIASTS